MEAGLALVLGGIKSGKSAFAASLASKMGGEVLYLATADPGDPEMAERVERHRASRPASWLTVEVPFVSSWRREGVEGAVVLVECMTLMLSNVFAQVGLYSGRGVDRSAREEVWRRVEEEVSALEGLSLRNAVIAVSNELGMGVIGADPLTRAFVDLHGRMNQRLASAAREVYLVTAGIPLKLKG